VSRLDPAELGARLAAILATAERMIRAVPEAPMSEAVSEGPGTLRDAAFRLFRLGLAFADGMDRGRFPTEWLRETAPDDLRDGAALARYGALVRGRLTGWFEGAAPGEFARTIAGHDGPQTGYDLLARVADEADRALRALGRALERIGRAT
jgi:hypothetical protein